MNILTKTILGNTLPYESMELATLFQAKFYNQCPSLVFLPQISKDDNIYTRTLNNLPAFELRGESILLHNYSEFKDAFLKIEHDFSSNENFFEDYATNSTYWNDFCNLLKKFQPKNAEINLLGPISIVISALFSKTLEQHPLLDYSFRRMLVQYFVLRVKWLIEEIKKISPETTPIIIFEEPSFNRIGQLIKTTEGLTRDIIVRIYNKLSNEIRLSGARIALQSETKCDWSIPIEAGVDAIIFNSYDNPHNLSIIPELVTDYLINGGKIGWGILPTKTVTSLTGFNKSKLRNKLYAAFDILENSGVPRHLILESAIVTPQTQNISLPLSSAEKGLMLISGLIK